MASFYAMTIINNR